MDCAIKLDTALSAADCKVALTMGGGAMTAADGLLGTPNMTSELRSWYTGARGCPKVFVATLP